MKYPLQPLVELMDKISAARAFGVDPTLTADEEALWQMVQSYPKIAVTYRVKP